MSQGLLTLKRVDQIELDYKTTDECQVSRVHFDLKTPDKVFRDLVADVKLSPGGDFTGDPFEVSLPDAISGMVKYDVFRKHVEAFYRATIGPTGLGAHMRPGITNISIKGIAFEIPPMVVPIEILDPKKMGW